MRRISVFFYGLFMDTALLEAKGVAPQRPQRAFIVGFALRLGQRAWLATKAGARVYGVVMELTHAELAVLYAPPDLAPYRPEAVLAETLDGTMTAALCYNLPEPPAGPDSNPEYAARLRAVLEALAFPPDYIASVR